MRDDTPILVTAGILTKGDRILICQRHRLDPYALQWEFPGGKVQAGEGLRASLRRELAEELFIDAEVGDEVFRLRHRYPDRYVEVIFFAVRAYRGEVRNRVFEAVKWAPRAELAAYDFLEADRELVARLARGELIATATSDE
jgi:8-oxo-dGTP diphosphatase